MGLIIFFHNYVIDDLDSFLVEVNEYQQDSDHIYHHLSWLEHTLDEQQEELS